MSFGMYVMPIERPNERAKIGQTRSRSAYNSPLSTPIVSPAGSRRGSVSSVSSAYTDPGHDRVRQYNSSHIEPTGISLSGLKYLFNRKDKKSKDKKGGQTSTSSSTHAPAVRTAGIVVARTTSHMTAAEQEARHPHSGPPALHPSNELLSLTRIISADEPDEEDEFEKNERLRMEYALSKQPTVSRVVEHASDESAEASADEAAHPTRGKDGEQKSRPAMVSRPSLVTRNSFGGRFRKDEKGAWRR